MPSLAERYGSGTFKYWASTSRLVCRGLRIEDCDCDWGLLLTAATQSQYCMVVDLQSLGPGAWCWRCEGAERAYHRALKPGGYAVLDKICFLSKEEAEGQPGTSSRS
jgi:hypothetical protein